MKLDSIYVAIANRKRAEDFYSDLFDRDADMRNETFTFFDLGGVLFGLFDPSAVNESVTMGTNCVPNFHVDDIDALHAKLKSAAIECDDSVRTVGPYRLFQFRDPDGNLLEAYTVTSNG